MKCCFEKNNKKCNFKAKYGNLCSRHVQIQLNNMNFLKKNVFSLKKSMLTKIPKNMVIELKKMFKTTSLKRLVELIQYYKKYEKNIVKIQSIFRGNYIRSIYGPCFLKRTSSVNQMDVNGTKFWKKIGNKKITVNEIEPHHYFSCKENNWCYAFDIRSLSESLKYSNKNPYSSTVFLKQTIDNFHKKMRYMKHHNLLINTDVESNFSEYQKQKFKVLDIINKIQCNTGYLLNPNWFLNLKKSDLLSFYDKLKTNWENMGINEKKIFYNENSNGLLFDYDISNKTKNDLFNVILDVSSKLIIQQNNKRSLKDIVFYYLTSLCFCSRSANSSLNLVI